MPFGIPSLDEAAALMEGAVQDNHTDLVGINSQIHAAVGQPVLDNRADLNMVQGRIRQTLAAQIKQGDKALDKVGNTLDMQLANAIVGNLTDMPGLAAPNMPPIGANSVPITPGVPAPAMPIAPIDTSGLTTAQKLALKQQVLGQAPPAVAIGQDLGYWCNATMDIVAAVHADGADSNSIYYMQVMPTQTGEWIHELWATFVQSGWSGPANTAAGAALICQGQALPPPMPPIPPAPPSPTPIPSAPPICPPCDQQPPAPVIPIPDQNLPPTANAPACSGVIPPIGSDAFCQAMPQIKQMLHDLGKGIIDWLIYGITPKIDATGGSTVSDIVSSAVNPFGSTIAPAILQTLVNAGSDYVQELKQKLADLQAMFSCISSCDVDSLFSVALVKTAIRLLRNFRVGTDALLWATVDTTFEIQQIEQLIDYVQNYICPAEIPSIGETMDAFTRGFISVEQYHCWMMVRGADPAVWKPVLRTRRERLQADESIQYARRTGATDQELSELLLHQGWTTTKDQQQKVLLYDKLPTIGDHLHWLQRNVFSTEYVQRYHLLDGFANDGIIQQIPGFGSYTSFAAPQRGYFWDTFGQDLYAQGMKIEYAARHYAAHWIMPSPEQMKQFVYRLRPDRVPADQVFTTADYDRILQEQDYNVLARQWFVATVNPVPAISYVKRMFQLGAIDATQLKAYHMDLGYTDKDSDNFVAVDKVDKARQLASSGHAWTPAAMASAYAVGQLTDIQVANGMDALGYPPEYATQLMARAQAEFDRLVLVRARSRMLYQQITTVKGAITAGTMSVDDGTAALVSMGYPPQQSASIAVLADVSARAALVKAAISRIRSAYRSGEVIIADAATRLLELGVVANRVQQLITLWQIENTPNRKRRTAEQIVSDVSLGHMSVEEALVRLTNLGYEDADRQLFLADIQGKTAKLAASKNAANIKAGKSQSAALAALARKAQATRAAALRRLKTMEPVAKLQKWLKLGIIDDAYFDGRMTLYEYSPGEIAAYKAEIVPKKG